MPLRTEHAHALGNEGYAAALQGDPPAMPTENFFLHREYLWGDGGEGPDELLAYVGTNRAHVFYPIQDGSGDVIAIADVTSDGAAGNPNALRPRILEQRVYAPYGEVVDFWQSPEVLNGTVALPPLAAGHKGLFFERLDAGALTWAGDGYVETHPYAPLATNTGATQHPYLIGHARNRTLHAVLGRWNQRDPNATGMVVVGRAAMHGAAPTSRLLEMDIARHHADGANVTSVTRSNPLGLDDPLGLFTMADLAVSTTNAADLYVNYNSEYVLNQGFAFGKQLIGIFETASFHQELAAELLQHWDFHEDDGTIYAAGGVFFSPSGIGVDSAITAVPDGGTLPLGAAASLATRTGKKLAHRWENHHIATQFGDRTQKLFKRLGMSMDNRANLIRLRADQHRRKPGNKTWNTRDYHDPKYHEWVERELKDAVKAAERAGHGNAGQRQALENALDRIRQEIQKNPRIINKFSER